MSLHNQLNESETRYNRINPLLEKAGWNLSGRRSVDFEIPVDGYDATPINGITDCCLYRCNGVVLAVMEAKRTKREARIGKEQLPQYITKIEVQQSFSRYGFLTNGYVIWFWDSNHCPYRPVADFFIKADFKRLLFLQQNCQPLSTVPTKESIVNRSYQVEAIRRISEHIEVKKKRKALLVMATGTGKTRTSMALVDVFLKARHAQKILFQADRNILVDQAIPKGFKEHIPAESWELIRTYLSHDLKEVSKRRGARVLVTHKHALRLEEAFNEMYPEYKILLARVINSQTERNKDLLKQFETESLPRIAISLCWHLYNIHHN